jgi:hypothetical protein
MANYDVIGIGNAIVDIIFPATDEFLLKHTIAKSVMTLIDEFRAAQTYSRGTGREESSGGSAANTMAVSRRLAGKAASSERSRNDRLGYSFADGFACIRRGFETAMATTRLTHCVLRYCGDARRSPQHEHLSRRQPRTDAADINPTQIGRRPSCMSKAICGTPKAAKRRSERRLLRQRARQQGRLHAFRPVLRRALSR